MMMTACDAMHAAEHELHSRCHMEDALEARQAAKVVRGRMLAETLTSIRLSPQHKGNVSVKCVNA